MVFYNGSRSLYGWLKDIVNKVLVAVGLPDNVSTAPEAVHLLHLAAQKEAVVPQQMSLAVSCVNVVAILSCAITEKQSVQLWPNPNKK